MIIIPIKWLFHWEYSLFSDKPIHEPMDFQEPNFTARQVALMDIGSSPEAWKSGDLQTFLLMVICLYL